MEWMMAFLEEILLVCFNGLENSVQDFKGIGTGASTNFSGILNAWILFSGQGNDLGSLRCWIRFSKDDQDDNTKIAFVFRGSYIIRRMSQCLRFLA